MPSSRSIRFHSPAILILVLLLVSIPLGLFPFAFCALVGIAGIQVGIQGLRAGYQWTGWRLTRGIVRFLAVISIVLGAGLVTFMLILVAAGMGLFGPNWLIG